MNGEEKEGGALPSPVSDETLYDYDDKRYSGLLEED